ncbi:hypothetical protein MVES1_002002 [Malassezia vespertilionis]|uniref:Uncharacterized protein n=1 Tax=Malassezia vespertilionis TaxID=2020962 RepID=A0A2N1JB81_9BASI|nr:uncharacterized protein MVES1_002002 [Malassezia vespertilionis]PKI83795.1 hypothetical protein MVES_001895 [Malassezia vespertilionis]WFD06648.1 hypothetical protein MVES1_002002 [Malassezia vespertilionis]
MSSRRAPSASVMATSAPWDTRAHANALADLVPCVADLSLDRVKAGEANGYEQDAPTDDFGGAPFAALEQDDPMPIFQLARVQYALTQPLVQLAVASNKMVMCVAGGAQDAAAYRLVYMDLDDPARTCEALVHAAPAPRGTSPAAMEPCCVYVDPFGEHILVSAGGHNYYWTPGWAKARRLPRLAQLHITSVAWATPSTVPPVPLGAAPSGRKWIWTPRILLGTAQGELFETVLTAQVATHQAPSGDFFDRLARKTVGESGVQEYTGALERSVHRVFQLHEAQAISGLALAIVQRGAGWHAYIVATTATRMYEFAGAVDLSGVQDAPSAFDALFRPYRDTMLTHLKTELPSDVQHSMLLCSKPSHLHGARRALAWLTGAGLFYAEMNLHSADTYDFVQRTGLLAYQRSDTPLCIGSTAYHHVLVLTDRVVCQHVMETSLVWEEALGLAKDERVVGIATDPHTGTNWVYTDAGIFELLVTDEARDVWRIMARRGEYSAALEHAPDDASKSLVLAQHGDALMREGKVFLAAQSYARTHDRSFEQVALQLAAQGANDALRSYVRLCLERLPHKVRAQRLMLATWLLELYLAQLSTLEDSPSDEDAAQGALLADELRSFLHAHRHTLDPPTTLAFLARNGRTDVWLAYAEEMHATRDILERWLRLRDFSAALDTLAKQSDLDLYYTFATPLLLHVPNETVACWIRQPQLDPARLVSALVQLDAPLEEPHPCIAYLNHVVRHGNTQQVVHDLLLTLLAECAANAKHAPLRTQARSRLERLIDGVDTQHKVYYDLHYALRVCVRKALREACVRLYARMDLYENAVQLALEADDVALACKCADLATDPSVRKDLWLACAKHVVQAQQSIAGAMQFLQRTEHLTIEDILPFLPDFVVIDGFKQEICDTLASYVERIDALKEEMEKTTVCAEHIQHDLQSLPKRFLHISADQGCEQCGVPLLQRQLYIFPCRHGFHVDCLTKEVTRHLPPRLLRRLLQLQEELERCMAPHSAPTVPGTSLTLDRLRERVRPQAIVDAITALGMGHGAPSHRSGASGEGEMASVQQVGAKTQRTDALPHVQTVREEMNTIVAGACPVCTLSVQQLTMPFIMPEEQDTSDEEAWAV